MVKSLLAKTAYTLGVADATRRLFSTRFRHEARLAKELSGRVDSWELAEIVRGHAGRGGKQGPAKYLRLDAHFQEMIREANRLGLLGPPPLSVLDLGCGTGAFLYVLKCASHRVTGLDIPGEPIYDDMVRLFGIPRVLHRIEPFEPLPGFEVRFDLITAYSICFDGHRGDRVWGPREWAYFINDCMGLLRPGGRISLVFNPATTHDFDFIPDEVAAYFRSLPGAALAANKETLLIRSRRAAASGAGLVSTASSC